MALRREKKRVEVGSGRWTPWSRTDCRTALSGLIVETCEWSLSVCILHLLVKYV